MNILLTTICPGKIDIQLALYYLKAYFMKYNSLFRHKAQIKINIQVFSANEKIEVMIAKISKYKPNIIGFSCYVWNVKNILKVAREMKHKNKKVKIILGGPEVSPRAKAILKYYRFIDVIVIGEGEITFKELIEYFATDEADISKINGIAFRQNNEIKIIPQRAEIVNLDNIPSPYLEGIVNIDFKKYDEYIPTETMRGCLFRCHYCYYHKEFKGLRYFSLERVERELIYLLKKSPKGIYLMDPTFNMNKQRAKEILRIFIKYNKKSHLHVELKAEFLDREMVSLLRKAKTNFIEIGIQSTNRKTLRLINRHFEPQAFKRGILLLNKKKVPYEIQLIDGLPQDSYKTLKDSIDWLMTLKPATIRIMRLMLLPGTYLRDKARNFDIRYNHRPPYFSLESNTFSPRDLKKTYALEFAMAIIYDSGLLRNAIYFIKRDLSLRYSQIFEEWYKWMQTNHKTLLTRKENGKIPDSLKIKSLIDTARFIKIVEKTEPFTEYLYKEYKHAKVKDSVLSRVRYENKQILKRRGIEISKNLNG